MANDKIQRAVIHKIISEKVLRIKVPRYTGNFFYAFLTFKFKKVNFKEVRLIKESAYIMLKNLNKKNHTFTKIGA